MTDVLLWRIFGRAVVAPAMFKVPRDLDAVAKTVADELPPVMDYLESLAPDSGFMFGATPGLADFSIASQFVNVRWARQTVDPARWPRATAWIGRVETSAPIQRLNEIGGKILRAAPHEHKPILESFGVATTATTVGTGAAPQRGPMTVI